MIEIKHDFKKFEKHIKKIYRKQIPYATSLAINSLSEMARSQMQDEYRDKLTIRNEGQIKRGITTTKSSKRDWPFVHAYVGVLDKFEYLVDHVKGINRNPRTKIGGSKVRAIPVAGVIKRTRRGKVSKSKRPKALLAKKSFVISSSKGNLAGYIATAKRGKVTIQYKLTKVAKIDSRVNLESRVAKVVRAKFSKEFAKGFAKAIRTAH